MYKERVVDLFCRYVDPSKFHIAACAVAGVYYDVTPGAWPR